MKNQTTHFFDIILVLVKNKLTILKIVFSFTILFLILSLVWTKTFKSSSEVIQLQQSSPSLGGLLQNIAPMSLSRSRVGGETILVILRSQILRNELIDKFNLSEVYNTEVKEGLDEKLNQRISIEEVREGGFGFNPIVSVKISVTDKEPERAFEMNQFILQKLDSLMQKYNRESTSETLKILENRYQKNVNELAEAEERLNRFQNEYGVIHMDTQMESLIENLASIKSEITMQEVEFSVLNRTFGRESQTYRTAELRLQELQNKYDELIERTENLDEVNDSYYPLMNIPDLMLRFVRLRRQVEIEQAVQETLYPQLEQQRITFENSGSGIQVVDEPNFPTYKDSPKRAYIVLAGVFLSIIISLIIVFFRELKKDPNSETAVKLNQIKRELRFRKNQ